MPKSRLLGLVIKELREILPPTIFFAVGFNLIVLTTDLILADYFANLVLTFGITVTYSVRLREPAIWRRSWPEEHGDRGG